ncbi:hypothetical protein FSP39_023363 [Pinctada imbricata]|uniref:Cyclin A n=1 Tax=Pinctada imbricata TaxID=66713 RepID=A0AA88YFQ1_PINIB|nr:hypothetical protein FSP39_023363 [Pinctada imbricata]
MSFAFGSSNFQSHQENAENGARRAKQIAARNGTKRAALGNITNQVRVQPSRAAKAGQGNDENGITKGKVFGQENQPFTIFVDENVAAQEPSKPVSKPLQSHNVLTSISSLNSRLAPLSTAPICIDDSIESPMVLDTSVEEVEEKEPLSREAIITTVPEYAREIYANLREEELKNRAKSTYMKKQQDITTSMRSILIDWLVEVSEEYKLHRETLFLTVNYIDRFLSQMAVQRGKLQLVGAASMFLAAKYEEIYPPDVGEFAYITDDTYTKKQVLRMESLILKVLSFDVAVPTANWFCDTFLKNCEADEKTRALAMFLLESTLIDSETYLKYLPSVVAAASTCLARCAMGLEPWTAELEECTQYKVGHFLECFRDLYKTYCNMDKCPQQAITDKYKGSKYFEIADFTKYPPPPMCPF